MNSTGEWERVSPSFGWHVPGGWNAVDISADGKRAVAGAKLSDVVRVFDFSVQ
jgi:hypothetical protein